MTRLTAKDFAPELLELYDGYAHGKINRRDHYPYDARRS